MGFNCGLVGLPNVGKSTIFNALTSAGAKVESYPFTTIDTNVGVVEVPDERLEKLAALYPEKRKVPTTLEFMDIAGLVKGANQGEGLGNQFLAEIRNVDAIAHVVRCFEDENIAHVHGSIDPKRDIEVVEMELLLKDLEALENALGKLKRKLKIGDKEVLAEHDLFAQVKGHVEKGVAIKDIPLSDAERGRLKSLGLLTEKPVLFVANVGDEGENRYSGVVKEMAANRAGEAIVIRGEIEMEIADTAETPEERKQYLQEWEIEESGLKKLVRAGYKLLGLITFFTTDGPEVRAWTVTGGTRCPQAGGKIHSDFEERFIQAEVIKFKDLIEHGSYHAVREAGLLHKEGEQSEVQDGDVIHFIAA